MFFADPFWNYFYLFYNTVTWIIFQILKRFFCSKKFIPHFLIKCKITINPQFHIIDVFSFLRYVKLPEKHFLRQDVLVDIMVDTGGIGINHADRANTLHGDGHVSVQSAREMRNGFMEIKEFVGSDLTLVSMP